MKSSLLSLLISASIFISTSVQASLQIYPSEPIPGSLLLLVVEGAEHEVVMEPFFDQEVTFYKMNTASVALLAIPLDAERGDYSLLAWEDAEDGSYSTHRGQFTVKYSERKVDRLTLPQKMVEPKGVEVTARIEAEYLKLRQIFTDVTEPVSWGCFSLPVKDEIGSQFGVRRILNGIEKSPHSGTDFRSPGGREIQAGAAGIVVLAAPLYYTGNTVVIDHGGGLTTLYAHLQSVVVSEGDSVGCGENIGKVGSTGRSTGPHLHWGVKYRGVGVDPISLIGIDSKLNFYQQ